MKPLNSQNILIASLLGLSTLLANSYPLVKAQSEPKLGCQATVDKVLEEIRSKGVRRTWFKLYKGRANEYNTENPTNRTDKLERADRIVANCSNTAIVGFGNDQSDWGEDYYIQSDGTTKLNKCVPAGTHGLLPWGVSHCL